MDINFSSYQPGEKFKIQFYLEVCSTLTEVEEIIKLLNTRRFPIGHISIIGKVRGASEEAFGCTANLTELTFTTIHLLRAADLGRIFVSGALSSLLLEKVDGKALGSLEGGIAGILNGYGINHKKTIYYLNHLKKGKLLILAWDYDQHFGKAYNPYLSARL